MIHEIKELIAEHQSFKDECFAYLQELNQISNTKLSAEDRKSLEISIIKAEEEYCWRGIMINQLKDLIC